MRKGFEEDPVLEEKNRLVDYTRILMKESIFSLTTYFTFRKQRKQTKEWNLVQLYLGIKHKDEPYRTRKRET